MFSIAKFGAKLAIVGSAVYLTVNNSIWDNSEYASQAIVKISEAFPETTEFVKQLPSSGTITNKWNQGVETVFNQVANSSPIQSTTNKLSSWLSSESQSSKNNSSKSS